MKEFTRISALLVEQGEFLTWTVSQGWPIPLTFAFAYVAQLPVAIHVLGALCVVDFLMGFGAAWLRRDIDWMAVGDGFIRKVMLLMGIGAGYLIDWAISQRLNSPVMDALVAVFPSWGVFLAGLAILKEVISILTHLQKTGAMKSKAVRLLTDRLRSIDTEEPNANGPSA